MANPIFLQDSDTIEWKETGDNLTGKTIKSSYDPAGSYTILDDDGYTHIIDSATGTVTLPTLADNYNRVVTIVRDVASSTTPLILDGEGAETIAGETTKSYYDKYSGVTIIASEDAGEWLIVEEYNKPSQFFYDVLGANTSVANGSRTLLLNRSIIKPAKYLITATLSFYNSSNDDRIFQGFIEKNNSSSTLTRGTGSISYITSATFDCVFMSYATDLVAGDSIRLLAQASAANGNAAGDQTSLSITEIQG